MIQSKKNLKKKNRQGKKDIITTDDKNKVDVDYIMIYKIRLDFVIPEPFICPNIHTLCGQCFRSLKETICPHCKEEMCYNAEIGHLSKLFDYNCSVGEEVLNWTELIKHRHQYRKVEDQNIEIRIAQEQQQIN